MDYITIDSRCVPIEGEKNLLSIIRKAGIDLPTFCYHSELSIYGACRLCVVEDDRGRIFASCSEQPRAGMVIRTNTKKIQKYRKLIIELLLASHCRDCTICEKNGVCQLQKLAAQVGVDSVRFLNNKKEAELDLSSPSIIRDPNKCILCGDCVRTCSEIQGIGVLDFAYRGSKMQVMPAFDKKLSETECVGCGQCRAVCPTAAITIKNDISTVWEAIADPNIRVLAQIAPAVRIAVGDAFGIKKGENSMGKLVASLRRMGFDDVYDTTFGADLTVMEESAELVERIQNNENLPLFTSCCPGWVKFCENRYPEFTENLSTCRSPQAMFSAVLKDHYREEKRVDDKKTFIVSIMPCTAKKGEAIRPEHFTDGEQDTDVVITTTEVIKMIKASGINFAEIEVEAPDMPFGIVSGGGVLFGVTGGVTEAVLRKLLTNSGQTVMGQIEFSGIRGEEGIKEATIMLGEREVKIAVVNGLANANRVMERIKNKEVSYDFVEMMACKRGCIMGGGQPPQAGARTKQQRMKGLYTVDVGSQVRKSNDNPIIQEMYAQVLKGKEHKLLHNHR